MLSPFHREHKVRSDTQKQKIEGRRRNPIENGGKSKREEKKLNGTQDDLLLRKRISASIILDIP
jgi:hypothetical protein